MKTNNIVINADISNLAIYKMTVLTYFYITRNSNFNFNGKICICNIEKHSVPNWNSTSYQNYLKNTYIISILQITYTFELRFVLQHYLLFY